MTFDEFMAKVLEQWPEAQVTEGQGGELIIETGVYSDERGQIDAMTHEFLYGQ